MNERRFQQKRRELMKSLQRQVGVASTAEALKVLRTLAGIKTNKHK